MSLPSEVINRLFDRLTATYGREWISKWEGVDIMAVKSLWAHELYAFHDKLKAIAWALDNLPPRCPNAIEFKQLCRQAPKDMYPQLDAPRAPEFIVNTELAKIAGEAFKKPVDTSGKVNHKLWAMKLKKRHDAGDKTLGTIQIKFYKTALGLDSHDHK